VYPYRFRFEICLLPRPWRDLVPKFFKHPVFQTQFRHQLLELLVLFAKLADFITVGLAHRIAFQALFSGL